MQRIVILGNAGSGKSTLARRIGGALDLPVVHLDLLFWGARWTEPDPEVFRRRVASAVSADRWVCEGNYSLRTFDLRLPRADVVIWLDTPRSICLQRVLRRRASGRTRTDLPPGCVERLDAQFLTFLGYVWSFDRVTRPGIEAQRLVHGARVPTVHLRGRRQIESCLQSPKRGAAQIGGLGPAA